MNEITKTNGASPNPAEPGSAIAISRAATNGHALPSPISDKPLVGERFGWRELCRTIRIIWVLGGFILHLSVDFSGVLGRFKGQEAKGERLFRKHAIRLRERLIKLGPTFIKIGQALGTRADLLPVQYLDELEHLQDRVPPVPNEVAFSIFAEELGQRPEAIFASITDEPVAAASLGQVYRAKLKSGQEVAVKIQRPHLEESISFDLKVLKRLARILDRYKLLRGQDWFDMMVEFDKTVHQEMDYLAEGRNAERFRSNFADWTNVHVPAIHWNYTTKRVLVMEFIHGYKVTDLDGLRAAGFNPRAINEVMVKTYFKQLLEDGFFHADPHPGNMRVMKDGRLAFFDFGMVGRITPKLQSQMITAFFHVIEGDGNGIVDDLIGLNFLAPEADVTSFRIIVADLFTKLLNRSLKDVKFKELTFELAPVMYEYPLSTPGSFTFIIRALSTLEGISIVMNPDFNFIEFARPYARDFIFRKESAMLRQQVWDSLRDAKSGQINWGRMWNLAKMAYSLYLDRS